MAHNGRASGVIARSGLMLGMGSGILLFLVLAFVFGATDNSPLVGIVAYSIVLVPVGLVIGLVAGAAAQGIARSIRGPELPAPYPPYPHPGPWPQPLPPYAPAPQPQFAAPRRDGLPPLPPIHPPGLGNGEWARCYQRCRTSVRRFHAIVEATGPGAGRDWLHGIALDLSAELEEALRLARYGYVLAPADPSGAEIPEPTAREIAQRLAEADQAFEATVARAGRIAVDLSAETDFDRIRAELAVLAEQAPHLRGQRGG
ncbi:hypothetical protein CFN78_01930 [Amycolatopsis antarctica]|uniref:Uncharacterized protein n=1 Tax=Amycolatopsis antarctica TaxID=1854586 RepID=A0A263DBV0_9PSEU|nr:hypothetical protein [Amycolatopsis antarctica]OZM74977.1 hypothetical protein CFN78_01930 [Amycolatopsis antarctica]